MLVNINTRVLLLGTADKILLGQIHVSCRVFLANTENVVCIVVQHGVALQCGYTHVTYLSLQN